MTATDTINRLLSQLTGEVRQLKARRREVGEMLNAAMPPEVRLGNADPDHQPIPSQSGGGGK
jgi:hypothetical protein